MKIFVKTLKGTHFKIEVKPQDTVVDVKKNIETVQGPDVYPAALQILIHQGKKVLKDNTTLEENNVAENSHVVIVLTKNKTSPGEGSTTSPAPTTRLRMDFPFDRPAPAPFPTTEPDVYGQAASNLVAGNNLEGTIQQILGMGGGTWDRDIVLRAFRAAFNNPERAVEYLYSGIPEQAEVPPVARVPGGAQGANPPAQPLQPTQPAPVPSSGPNANPLDLFPQGLPDMGSGAAGVGSLEFLRSSQQLTAQPPQPTWPTPVPSSGPNANPWDIFPQGLPYMGSSAAGVGSLEFLHGGQQLTDQPPQPTWPTPVPSSGPNANPWDIFPQGLPYMGSGAAGVGSLEFLRCSQQLTDQPPQPTWPTPVPSSGPNANPWDIFPQGLPYMGSGAAGVGSLEFLRCSQQLTDRPRQPTWPTPVPSSGPNANPWDIFPQGLPYMGSVAAGVGSLEFLSSSQQFQAMRAIVQANPQILQPMLQELGKQNPQLMRLIQEHQADFLRLINEPVEGGEGNIGSQLAAAMPQSVTVTPEEREAIERLEAMGFDRALVLEVFFACNKNEELAANYLLEHRHEFED